MFPKRGILGEILFHQSTCVVKGLVNFRRRVMIEQDHLQDLIRIYMQHKRLFSTSLHEERVLSDKRIRLKFFEIKFVHKNNRR